MLLWGNSYSCQKEGEFGALSYYSPQWSFRPEPPLWVHGGDGLEGGRTKQLKNPDHLQRKPSGELFSS